MQLRLPTVGLVECHDANHWGDFRYPWPAAGGGLAALAGCDGDVGSSHVLARLGGLAPVHAVRGNVDHGAPWSAKLPVTQRIEIDGFRIYVLHILELDPQAADNVDAVRAASAYPSRSAA